MIFRRIINTLLFVWLLLFFFLTLIRNYFGIEITDEAFYISEALSVLRGNVPYTYTMGRAAGFTFILLPIIKIYSVLIPDLEGIFLYTRIVFMAFRVGILILSFYLLRKYYKKRFLVFLLSLLLPVWGISIPNFSYNTISIWLLFLTGVIQLSTIKSENEKRIFCGAVLSGVIVAFAEFAHIAQVLSVFLFGLTYLLCGKRRYRAFLAYIFSGLITLFSVLGIIFLHGGIDKFIFGIETIARYTNTQRIDMTVYEQIDKLFNAFQGFIKIFFDFIVIALFFRCIASKSSIFENTSLIKYIKKIGKNIRILDAVLLAMTSCIKQIFENENAANMCCYLGGIGGILFILCWIDFFRSRDIRIKIVILTLMTFSLSQFIITGFFTDTTALSRLDPLVFGVFGFGLLLEPYFYKGNIARKILTVVSMAGFFGIILYADYKYVYRDEVTYIADSKVEQGIYKNIYTSAENAKNIVELEDYIKENVSKEDKVYYMDLAPMAYLMSEATPWTPSTWDRMQYSHGFNCPDIVYRYFESKGDIPDIVIYIDFGRDKVLSIDRKDYLFNDFINRYYLLEESRSVNKGFKVKKYVRINKK